MALISLAGIAEAIDNLNLNEATLKGKLLNTIRDKFTNEESLDTVTKIDPLELIHTLWEANTPAEIKAKRKNLSSLKSGVNKVLKEGIKDGTNPEGIIIGRDNVFIISEEKKNLLLDKLSLEGVDSHALLSTLAAINNMLSGAATPADQNEALQLLDKLDSTRKILSKLAGLPEKEEEEDVESLPPTPREIGEETPGDEPVEEFEIDDDTVIEFIDDETSPPSEEESDGGDGDQHSAAAGFGEEWDSFEIIDDAEIIDAEDEVVEADGGLEPDLEVVDEVDDQKLVEVEGDLEEVDEESIELGDETEEESNLDLEDDLGEGAGLEGDEELADDWNSCEVVEDDD